MASEDAILLAGMADYSSAEQPSVQLSDVLASGAASGFRSLGEFIEGGSGYFFGGDDVIGEPGISADLRGSVLAKIGEDPIGSIRKAGDWADEQLLAAFRGDAEAARNSADMASFVDQSGVSDALSAISSARLAYDRPSEQLGGHLFDVGISTAAAALPLVGSGFLKRIIKGAPEVVDVARAEDVSDVAKAAPTEPVLVFESAAETLAAGLPDKLGVQALEGTLGRKKHQKAGQVAEYTQDVKDKDTGKIIHKKGDKRLAKSGEEIVYPEYVYKDITAGEWSDTKLDEFIETAKASGKKSISKDDLIRHLEDNKVQIEEVRLGGDPEALRPFRKAVQKAYGPARKVVKAFRKRLSGDGIHTSPDLLHRLEDNIDVVNEPFQLEIVNLARQVRGAEDLAHQKIFSFNRGRVDPIPDQLTDEAQEVADFFRNRVLDPGGQHLSSEFDALTIEDQMLEIEEAFSKVNDLYTVKRKLLPGRAAAPDRNFIFAIAHPKKHAQKSLTSVSNAFKSTQELKNSDDFKKYESAMRDFQLERAKLPENIATYKTYTVPGGTDYRELLLTVPNSPRQIRAQAEVDRIDKAKLDLALDQGMSLRSDVPLSPEMAELSEQSRLAWNKLRRVSKKPFTGSHHSDIPNVMVHIRFKTRIDSRGRRILFIEEIQSDWHQAGLKRGYKGTPKKLPDEIESALQRFESAAKDYKDWESTNDALKNSGDLEKAGDYFHEHFPQVNLRRKNAESGLERAIASFVRDMDLDPSILRSIQPSTSAIITRGVRSTDVEKFRVSAAQALFGNPLPDAPLKDTKEWAGLAVKRIFRLAADEGYDGVAFTTGKDIQAASGGKIAGQEYFYDKLLPSIAAKESFVPPKRLPDETTKDYHKRVKAARKSHRSNTLIDIEPDNPDRHAAEQLFPFFELTKEVKDKVIKPQKLYSFALPGIAIGAAAAGEEELSAAAAIGAIGMGGMALYRGAKGARGAARAADFKVPTETAAYEGQQKVGKVLFDSKDGMGAVPNSANVAYRGFVVWMKPRDFLGLNPVRSTEGAADTVKAVTKAIEEGKPIGPPFLSVKLVKEGENAGSFQVIQHEGRGRMAAINDIDPDTPVPVHIFGRGAIDRGRDITPEMMEDLVDPGSKVRLLPDKTVAEGKEVTPDAAWHVPDSDDYDPNYLPVGKTYRAADVAKPPAAEGAFGARHAGERTQYTFEAPTKLPETPDEIEAAFSEMNRIQRGAPESAMDGFRFHNRGEGPAGFLTEHIGDLTARLGHRAYGPVAEKVGKTYDELPGGFVRTKNPTAPLKDVLTDHSYRKQLVDEGYRRYSMIDKGEPGFLARDEWVKQFDQKLANYADEHRKVPVYNEVQRLANDAAIALGEQRYLDSRDAMAKLRKYLDEGEERFRARMSWIEPEFARFPGGEIPPGKAVKTELPDFSAEYKQAKEQQDLVGRLMASKKASEKSDALKAAVKSVEAKPPAAATDIGRTTVDGVRYKSRTVDAAEMRKDLESQGHSIEELRQQGHSPLQGFEDYEPRVVNIDDIPTGGDFKVRDPERVRRATKFIESGEEMTPPQVGLDADGKIVSISDGVHRIAALRKAGKKQIVVDTYKPPAAADVATATAASEAAEDWRKFGTKAPRFREWFGRYGGAVLTDNLGEPIRLYHSTTKSFDAFRPSKAGLMGPGIYTSLSGLVVNAYIVDKELRTIKSGANVIPLFSRIRNPVFLMDPIGKARLDPILKKLSAAGIEVSPRSPDGIYSYWDLLTSLPSVDRATNVRGKAIINKAFQDMGHDSSIFSGRLDFMRHRESNFVDAPPDMHVLIFDPTDVKSPYNKGTFDPTDPRILWGAGLGAAGAAKASKLDDETGNPFGDDYEPLKADVTDYVADFQELSDEDFSLDELDRQSDMIVAEYSSLSDEEKLGRRGGILVEWYDEVSDQISAASQEESAGEYERFLRGPEAYLPAGGSGTDDLRGFVQVGFAPRVDRSLIERGLVEDAQRERLVESLEQGSPMVDLYGRFGKLNRYLFSKARHYGEPVGTVQLSSGDKLVLSGDRENLDRLSRSGLITDLLYRELLGSVKLLPFGG